MSSQAARSQAPAPSIWLIGGVGAALCAAVAVPPGMVGGGPVLCPFLRLTGLPCPTCGMTRAWVALGHGDWSSAVHLNPLTPVVFGTVLVWLVVLLLRRAGRDSPQWFGKLLVPLVVAGVGVYGFARIGLVATGAWGWPG